ncbi:MAG: hypothetical protein QOJ44_333 [Acidimicrobiaceae bacterium]|nr:hypothetical protein [Acidimicrobiaceae bacterium]
MFAAGGKMHEHTVQAQEHQQQAFRQYVQQAAGTPGPVGSAGSTADQPTKVADLKSQGVLTDAEFEQVKILA